MKKVKEPQQTILKPNKWNKISGKELQDMGFRVDSNGYLIAATLDYEVFIRPSNFDIRQLVKE